MGNVVCAWCGHKLDEQDNALPEKPAPRLDDSHGICNECRQKLMRSSKKDNGSTSRS